MGARRLRRGPVVALAALVLGVLIAQIAVAGAGDSDQARIAKLERQVKQLTAQNAGTAANAAKMKKKAKRGPRGPAGPQGAPGPAGPQGPPGTAPACEGNGSGDTMVAAGSVCIDRYEVSVWSSPTGGTQYGANTDDYPAACTDTGQGCKAGTAGEIYARSVPGVPPSSLITYFQAQQALANVGKRLPTNAEWQQAVAGTPNSTACNISTGVVASTGANAACISNHGANDMVGNLEEWVGDWVPVSTHCPDWGAVGTFSSDDTMCLSGASTTVAGPGALVRGGTVISGADAGPFAVTGFTRPSLSDNVIGFRGAR